MIVMSRRALRRRALVLGGARSLQPTCLTLKRTVSAPIGPITINEVS